MKDVLAWHRARYPLMQAEDVVKLVFQARMGCGHLLRDEADVVRRIEAEEAALLADGEAPLTEPLGESYVRLSLRRAMAEGITPAWIARLMALSCREAPVGSRREVMQALSALPEDATGVSARALAKAMARLPEAEWLPGHSAAYRAAYAPAYRVISRDAARLLPVLRAIAGCPRAERLLIAIDGPCASGKTTLAAQLSAVLGGAPVVHMDDFFTPHDRKTPQRLAQPGGNADVERFTEEFLTPWLRDGHAAYRPYDCHEDRLLPPVAVPPSRVAVVEGAYCLHPRTGRPYDVEIFLRVDPAVQRSRIQRRNGPAMWERFRDQWIPLEAAYFAAYHLPDERCLTLDAQGAQC